MTIDSRSTPDESFELFLEKVGFAHEAIRRWDPLLDRAPRNDDAGDELVTVEDGA